MHLESVDGHSGIDNGNPLATDPVNQFNDLVPVMAEWQSDVIHLQIIIEDASNAKSLETESNV